MTVALAIGMRCKDCEVLVHVHYAYLENYNLYLQGICPECKTETRFSADELTATLLGNVLTRPKKDLGVQ